MPDQEPSGDEQWWESLSEDSSPCELEPTDLPPEPDLDREIEQFYRERYPDLVAFLMYQGASSADAADCAHDAIRKACERWEVLHAPYTWCRRVAARTYGKWAAQRRREEVRGSEGSRSLAEPFAPDELDVFEQRHDLLRAIKRHLTPEQQRVVAWTFDGATPAEIAFDLGITAEAVRSRLRDARQKMRRVEGKEDR